MSFTKHLAWRAPWRPMLAGAVAALAVASARASAQTDYYNTDAGRPITVEDAQAIEWRALELQVAPLRLQRAHGTYTWGVEPGIAIGLLPRTQVELGAPLAFVDLGPSERAIGLAGLDLSVLHTLNVETRLPSFAIAGGVLLPVGSLAPERAYPSVKGIMTRTLPWARVHLNGQYTFGTAPNAIGAHAGQHAGTELSRWMGGLAVDHTLPLESLLLTAELVAHQPLVSSEPVAWDAGTGARYQLSPRVAADAGIGYRLTGDDDGWFVTFGAAVAVGLPWSAR